jgi:hypothetical protein
MASKTILDSMRGRRSVLRATAWLSLWLVTRDATARDKGTIAPFLGSFRHAGGDAEREARDAAIDDVVSGMSFLVRGIARARLRAANAIAGAVRIAAEGDRALTVGFDARSYTAPLDGTAVHVVGITGDELDLRLAFPAGRIEQRFDADGKGRINTFVVSDRTLTIAVRVHSTQLPKELRYTLTYTRG